jgi:hypothetical protein
MVTPACPLIVLGVFLTGSFCFYVGGCVMQHNWYPLLTFIPAALAGLCGYCVSRTDGDTTDALIGQSAWVFLAALFGGSCIGLPLVLFHVGTVDLTSLLLHLGGDVCVGIGIGLFGVLSSKASENDFGSLYGKM